MRRNVSAALFLVWPLFGACEGRGSDIGPRFPNLTDASCKVQVFDDQGRGVVAATVRLPDLGFTALTGRNGRGDLLATPRGRVRVRVQGDNAAATAGDRLATLDYATTVLRDLPTVAHLPALPDSASAAVTAGTQGSTTAVTSVAGTILTVAAASSLSLPAAATTGFLRLGDLQPQHLPGDLPAASGSTTLLFTRGVFVEPADATFTAGATLDFADELSLPASRTATLYRLDASSGEWVQVVAGIAATGGRLVAPSAVAVGGLYAFAAAVPSATVSGRLLDAFGAALPEQMVCVDGRWVVTGNDGRFTVTGIPGEMVDGSARSASVEAFAGGSWLPTRLATSGAVTAGGSLDLGDLTFNTTPCMNVRFQQVKRGLAEPRRRLAASSVLYPVAAVTTSDARGQGVLEDMPTQWFGFQEGHPFDRVRAFYAQGLGYVAPGRRWHDVYMFFDELYWFVGARRSRVIVSDDVGGASISGAGVVRGSTAGQGFLGLVRESPVAVDRALDGRATASFSCDCDGLTVKSALSIVRPNGEHLEMPLEQAPRAALGAFDRHGLVAGTLSGANPARAHELRSTRWLEASEWWRDVVDGVAIRASVPLDVDPGVTHGDFRIGVDAVGGHIAATELNVGGGVRTLEKLGVALAVEPVEGAVAARDIALDLPATTTFVVPSALTGLHASIAVADLRLALALEQPGGRFIDVVRDLGGNHAAAAADLSLTLPALAGPLANHAWRVLVQGSALSSGQTIVQKSLLAARGVAAETAVPMLAPPLLAVPTPGATVPAAGFTVQFALPAGALFGRIDLVNEVSGERNTWRAYVPPDATEFTFVTLPAEVTTPLVAGRNYTLTVSAFRADDSVLQYSDDSYRDVTTFLLSVSPVEVGVVAMSSSAITVTTN